MPVGVLVLPDPADVRAHVGYGANGDEFVGTAVVPVDQGTAGGVSAAGRNDLVSEAVRAKLDAALPDDWTAYAVRDLKVLPGMLFPMSMAEMEGTVLMEEETDNRVLTGYTVCVVLAVREAAVQRTDTDLTSLRRQAQQAVYTTNYPTLAAAGLSVEWVTINETCPPPDFGKDQAAVTFDGFTLTLGILESREVAQ